MIIIVFLLNLHLLSYLNLIKSAVCSTPDQYQSSSNFNNVEGIKDMDLHGNILDIRFLTAKQYNFIYYLCYAVIDDVTTHGTKAKISNAIKKSFENEYFYLNYLVLNTWMSIFKNLNKEIINELKKGFKLIDIKFIENIMEKQLNMIIDIIKNINSNLDFLQNIVSTLEKNSQYIPQYYKQKYYKKDNQDNEQNDYDTIKIMRDIGIKYIREVESNSKNLISEFIKEIKIAKANNSIDFTDYEITCNTIFKKHSDRICNIVERYEKEISVVKLSKMFFRIKEVFICYLNKSMTFYFNLFSHLPKVSMVSICDEFKYFTDEMNKNCSYYIKKNVNSEDDIKKRFGYYKRIIDSDFYCINCAYNELRKIFNKYPKNSDKNIKTNSYSDNLLGVEHSKKLTQDTLNENLSFNNNIKTLFKMNMRVLIVLKIIFNVFEYFEIYHCSYLKINNVTKFNN